jgi:hypothetical protein
MLRRASCAAACSTTSLWHSFIPVRGAKKLTAAQARHQRRQQEATDAARPRADASRAHGSQPPRPSPQRVDVPIKTRPVPDARGSSANAFGDTRTSIVRGQPPTPALHSTKGLHGREIPPVESNAGVRTEAAEERATGRAAPEQPRGDTQREQWTKAGAEIEVDENTMRRVMRLTPKVRSRATCHVCVVPSEPCNALRSGLSCAHRKAGSSRCEEACCTVQRPTCRM